MFLPGEDLAYHAAERFQRSRPDDEAPDVGSRELVGGGSVTIAGVEEHREARTNAAEALRKLQPRKVRHYVINDSEVKPVRLFRKPPQCIEALRLSSDLVPEVLEHVRGGIDNLFIVVHNQD